MTDLIEKLEALPVYGRVTGTSQGRMVLLGDVLQAVRDYESSIRKPGNCVQGNLTATLLSEL